MDIIFSRYKRLAFQGTRCSFVILSYVEHISPFESYYQRCVHFRLFQQHWVSVQFEIWT